MKAVIVGGSAGLGRALAEQMAARGHDLLLVASDRRDLDALCRDLSLRFNVRAEALALDLLSVNMRQFEEDVVGTLGIVDALFMVAGFGDDEDAGPLPEERARRLIEVNYAAPVMIVNALLSHLMARPEAHIVGIGSVASIRGRKRNMIYGSAKRGLEFYFAALRHRLAGTGCRVQFYLVGFMATTMLGDRRGLLVARPEAVAQVIAARIGGPEGASFLPRWWAVMALVLRLIPWPVFRRLDI